MWVFSVALTRFVQRAVAASTFAVMPLVSTEHVAAQQVIYQFVNSSSFSNAVWPNLINVGSGAPVQRIVAGYNFVVALRADGSVGAWGDGNGHLLVNGTAAPGSDSLESVLPPGSASRIVGNDASAFAIQPDGRVLAWGSSSFMQLGFNGLPSVFPPQTVPDVSSVTNLATRGAHALALRNNGTVYSWGRNLNGQLGRGATSIEESPDLVPSITNVTAVAAGANYSLALLSNGTVMSWGQNNVGQLGLGFAGWSPTMSTPRLIPNLQGVTSIAAAGSYSFALLQNGTVMQWGSDSVTPIVSTPAVVAGLPPIQSILALGNAGVAIDFNGNFWTWNYTLSNPSQFSGTPQILRSPLPGYRILDIANSGSARNYYLLLEAIPSPSSFLALSLGCLVAGRRRRN